MVFSSTPNPMPHMRIPLCLVSAFVIASVHAQSVQISIGTRETGFAGNPNGTIAANGGFGGGIEWINKDGQTLVLNGTWQLFTFDLDVDPVAGFAGTSANSILEGLYGTLEHIRVLNNNGVTAPMTLLIDDVQNSTTSMANGGPDVEDFELWTNGDEVLFQEPGFSGSTSGNVLAGGTAGVDNTLPTRTPGVYRVDCQFVDTDPTRWVRLTSFNATNTPNAVIRYDDDSVVSFWMCGWTECAADLGSQGPGNAFASLCGTGLNAGEGMTFSAGGAPANTFGAVLVSFPGFPDLPIQGGNVVSGAGFQFPIAVGQTNADGYVGLTLNGDATVVDFVLQGIFIDLSLPEFITFTNAVQASYGQ